jgi:transposase
MRMKAFRAILQLVDQQAAERAFMRITTVFRHLLRMQAVRVRQVELHLAAMTVLVEVALSARALTCSRCGFACRRGCYDSHRRCWRHLDIGRFKLVLHGTLRRFLCPHCDAVVTEAVPWADLGSDFTRDFEDVTSFLAQQASKTVVSRLMGIAWQTVGNIIGRTVARLGLGLRARRLYAIGVDEVSYRKGHKYLTVVADHLAGQIVWGGEGRSGATLGSFFDELGDDGCRQIRLVSMDMCQAYIREVRARLPHATIVFDPFHVVKLANDALDEVRRAQVRALRLDPALARVTKRTRWLLLKAPENLLPGEQQRLADLSSANRPLYRAYLLKEALRAIYRTPPDAAPSALSRWLAWASRSRLPPFIKLARTIRTHRAGILAAIDHRLSNGRLEALNNKIRLLSHRAFGFHSAAALLALVYLCCAGITIPIPQDARPWSDPSQLLAQHTSP